uniref:Protein FAR1-RELATED SEQUENCE n=1 Tax=Loa loa TaxID=7209 RepID=A0A1I7W0H7_LOALO
MTSPKRKVEVHEQLPTTTSQCAVGAESIHIENAMSVDLKKVTSERDLWMQAESSTGAAELQTAKQMRKEKMKGGCAIEAAAKALMKRTENEMENTRKVNEEFGTVAVGNRSGRNKRKTNFIRRIIQNDIEQSGSKTENTVQLSFDETEEKPVDLSNRNGQDNLLDKQPDKVMSGEQHCKERSRKRNGKEGGNASSSVKRKRTESKLANYSNRTFSTFTPAEQKELWRNSSFIYEGATFSSYEQFQECFEAYKRTGNYPYRTASSEILRDGEGRMIDRFKYKYVVFHCARYGIPRRRVVCLGTEMITYACLSIILSKTLFLLIMSSLIFTHNNSVICHG